MGKRQVFYQTDERGVTLLSISIYSLLQHNDPTKPLTIYIAHNAKFAEQHCAERLRDVTSRFPGTELRFADFDPIFEKYRDDLLLPQAWWSSPMYANLFFTEIFPELSGNLLYIDWDTLVTRDLGELFEMDLKAEGFVLAAVNEASRAERTHLGADWPESAGDYFNNGIMLVDIDGWKATDASNRMRTWYAANRSRAKFIDQDAANVILGTRTKRLPMRWNYCDNWLRRFRKFPPWAKQWHVYSPREILDAILDPYVIHFYGGKKPNVFTHRPERRRFYRVMKELGLYHRPLPGETPFGRVECFFFDIQHLLLRTYARIIRLFR